MNILMLSAGRRCELLKDIRNSMEKGSHIIATDNSKYAPALYFADRYYLVPRIDEPGYIDVILDICRQEEINVVTTLIDPEIVILAQSRCRFEKLGIEVLAPYEETAKICFDKYLFYKQCLSHNINTVKTYGTLDETVNALNKGDITFPVFVKPRCGSGSVCARAIDTIEELQDAFKQDDKLIAQEYMCGLGVEDLDADVYIDTISYKPVSIFTKKKISSVIGGANKTLSFADERLFRFIIEVMECFKFNGPIDIDVFYKNDEYYISEINPRFGGAYLHTYGAGVDFIKLIENNLHGIANEHQIGNYDENSVMMMYDSVIVRRMEA